jgi:hypothetical protein
MQFDEESLKNIGNDSIFSESNMEKYQQELSGDSEELNYEEISENNPLLKMIDTLQAKISKVTSKEERELRKLQKQADKLFEDCGDMMQLLKDFGCVWVIKDEHIEVQSKKLNITGIMTLNEDGVFDFDENMKKILYIIGKVVQNVDEADRQMDKHESEGFYPIGSLEECTIMLDGAEVKVLKGTLQNEKGETKQVYFKNGREVSPDK